MLVKEHEQRKAQAAKAPRITGRAKANNVMKTMHVVGNMVSYFSIQHTVAQKTAPMFAHFGKIDVVRSNDIS